MLLVDSQHAGSASWSEGSTREEAGGTQETTGDSQSSGFGAYIIFEGQKDQVLR